MNSFFQFGNQACEPQPPALFYALHSSLTVSRRMHLTTQVALDLNTVYLIVFVFALLLLSSSPEPWQSPQTGKRKSHTLSWSFCIHFAFKLFTFLCVFTTLQQALRHEAVYLGVQCACVALLKRLLFYVRCWFLSILPHLLPFSLLL